MTRLLSLSFLLVLANSQALAQKICDSDNPTFCSMALRIGDKAEFAGQLLTADLAIRLGQKASFCEERLKLEVEYAKSLDAVSLGLERELRKNEVEALKGELALTKERAKIPFYERPLFVATVTFLLTGALVGGTAWVLRQVK